MPNCFSIWPDGQFDGFEAFAILTVVPLSVTFCGGMLAPSKLRYSRNVPGESQVHIPCTIWINNILYIHALTKQSTFASVLKSFENLPS